ncbi:antibiotic biosynthesis monooxygenase family protein [Amycolatopsis rhabdoformis]|uniref:Antibiotic biosynthesis monooxygenase family protein n=1 Tax=Amycolatopsis rhabdoformis TaxID=1448059 RepID=A0ABZ1ICJ1_9PSEU|nr:antibiotic biosynthesis monooxygenase family protein [Amycolatopsis rhabdoformis]WSE31653.1 antibiotic biosynthesis monooxygenase family protein [Amycolatopsis rhabdoformis]
MVTEIATLTALPGGADELGRALATGVPFLREHPDCRSAKVSRCVEEPGRFTVAVDWTSVEGHEQFRSTPLFRQWIGSIAGRFDPATLDTRHYEEYPA